MPTEREVIHQYISTIAARFHQNALDYFNAYISKFPRGSMPPEPLPSPEETWHPRQKSNPPFFQKQTTRRPPTVLAHTHLIGPHACNFSTNQSDAYTFSTAWPISGLPKQHQPIPGLQIQHGGILLVAGRCNVRHLQIGPTACIQATRRVWLGNPAFKTSKAKQKKKVLFSIVKRTWERLHTIVKNSTC